MATSINCGRELQVSQEEILSQDCFYFTFLRFSSKIFLGGWRDASVIKKALSRDLGSALSTLDSSQLSLMPVPGDLTHSSGLYWHQTLFGAQTYTDKTLTHAR